MQLFPHVLIRISGGPFTALESLELPGSIGLSGQLFQLKQKLVDLKEEISNTLYTLISRITDPKLQNTLVNCRRDIFNERDIPSSIVKQLENLLEADTLRKLREYLETKQTITRILTKGKEIFAHEQDNRRHNLHYLAKEETLQKGLLLSSQSLLERIDSYISHTAGNHATLNKKESQTERGLIKYISRMYGKTSPFSTFTNLAMGQLQEKQDHLNEFLWLNDDKTGTTICHIRLNNFLYSYLKTLMCKNRNLYSHFYVRPNPTLEKEETDYLFLTNNDNIEAFQRIPLNPVLDVFVYLANEKKEGIKLEAMINSILENEYIDAPAEEIEAYIMELIDYGFLEFNIGVSGIDPDWDIKLCEVLNKINETSKYDLLSELIETLKAIRIMAVQYGESGVEKRKTILEEAFQRFKQTCMKLHEAAGLPENERIPPGTEQKKTKETGKRGSKEPDQNANPEGTGPAQIEPAPGEGKRGEEGGEEQGDEQGDEPGEEPGTSFKHSSNTYFRFKPEQMFYEDTTVELTPCIDEKQLTAFTQKMNELLQAMKRFEGTWDEKEKMRHFFMNHYGANTTVELLTFYEEFYRKHKKPETEWQRKREQVIYQQQNLKENLKENKNEKDKGELENLRKELDAEGARYSVPGIMAHQAGNKAWLESLAVLVKEGRRKKQEQGEEDTIHLWGHDLEKINEKHRYMDEGGIPSSIGSFGSFIQFYVEKDAEGSPRLMGVINSTFPGFGKLYSRFMHIYTPDKTEAIRQWNQSFWLQGEPLLVEDCDASYFNANLHPPLLPYEVRIPGGHNTLAPEQQIPITELRVKANEPGQPLQLMHEPTGKQVYVMDLGFQGHLGRSQLFQLLEKFSLARYIYPMPLLNAVNQAMEEGDGKGKSGKKSWVQYFPRVIYDGCIVLRRKTWMIKREGLPIRQARESEWEYFLRVDHWRRELGMPEDVFVHVMDRMAMRQPAQPARPGEGGVKMKARPSRDDYKPQYISFRSSFLVNLLEKLLNRVPQGLTMVEMLPNPSQLLTIGKERHIVEFTLQWYTGMGKRGDGDENQGGGI